MNLVDQFFEKVYDMSNTTLPISGRTMGKTTSYIDDRIKEPHGNTSDEIIQNIADDASEILSQKAATTDDQRLIDNADQIITQVVYDKMTHPSNAKFQKAIIDTALSEDK